MLSKGLAGMLCKGLGGVLAEGLTGVLSNGLRGGVVQRFFFDVCRLFGKRFFYALTFG